MTGAVYPHMRGFASHLSLGRDSPELEAGGQVELDHSSQRPGLVQSCSSPRTRHSLHSKAFVDGAHTDAHRGAEKDKPVVLCFMECRVGAYVQACVCACVCL